MTPPETLLTVRLLRSSTTLNMAGRLTEKRVEQ